MRGGGKASPLALLLLIMFKIYMIRFYSSEIKKLVDAIVGPWIVLMLMLI